jgi:hypothetical protein
MNEAQTRKSISDYLLAEARRFDREAETFNNPLQRERVNIKAGMLRTIADKVDRAADKDPI